MIEAIANMKPTTSKKEVQKCICRMNYYRKMKQRLSNKLVSLTKLTGIKIKFIGRKLDNVSSTKWKRIVYCDNLFTYPYFDENFKITTDARSFQLGVVISHKGKHIYFLWWKTYLFQTTVYNNREITNKHCRNPEGV